MATTPIRPIAAVTEAPADPDWRQGWWRRARALPSPNANLRPSNAILDLVVLHSISLPPGCFGGDEIERLFANTLDCDAHPYFDGLRGLKVSAHFLVRRGGDVTQFVSCEDRAWHAGASRWQGREGCNDFSIGVELEGLEGDTFEDAQYQALAALLPSLAKRYPIAEVVGHEHVSPGRKSDPGPGFDWTRLQRALTGSALRFPALAL